VLYRWALVGVERNGPGLSVLGFLEHGRDAEPQTTGGYPRLYYEQTLDEIEQRQTRRLGWTTTRVSKPFMLQGLAHCITENTLVLRSRETVDELSGFSRNPERKSYEQTYRNPVSKLYNDDEVISLAIACQMADYALNDRFVRRVTSCD
jgi:hypothetical protein